MSSHPENFRGRGAQSNPKNRFEARATQAETLEFEDELDGKRIKTQVFADKTRSLLTRNDSPDIPFEYGLNPYRGCEHGCVYCYARPYHEYLGLSAGLDFETKIFAKFDAAELLKKEFSSKRWQPAVVAMSGVTDCYQPIEKHLEITRSCLEVFAEFRNPVGLITKNALVTRDIDLLKILAAHSAVHVFISITSLDSQLARILEPRASMPAQRLEAVRALSEAGAKSAGYTLLRLPHAVKELFQDWLLQHFPDRKNKVLHRLEELRSGKWNDPRFGKRMRGEGVFAEQIQQLFNIAARKSKMGELAPYSTQSFRRLEKQMSLF